MIKIRNLILVLTLVISSCNYTPRVSSLDLHYQLGKWIEDPEQFLADINPIIIGKVRDTIYNGYDSIIVVTNGKQKLVYKIIDWNREKDKVISMYNNKKYRDYVISGVIDGFLYNIILYTPILSKIPRNSITSRNMKYIGIAYKKQIKLKFKCTQLKLKLKLEEGNSKYGMRHIKVHTPMKYILDGTVPSVHKTLFLKSGSKYIKGLLKQFLNKTNIVTEVSKFNVNNVVLKTKLKINGIYRNYILVYNKNTKNIITFYPETKFSLPMFKLLKDKGYDNYVQVKTASYNNLN